MLDAVARPAVAGVSLSGVSAPSMSVDDASFLTSLFGGETPFPQQFRELAVNGCEAAVDGRVSVRFSQVLRGGVAKLAVTDTGCGMSCDELVERFTKLACSGKTQSLAGNFGVGAKITAGTRNPAGLEVISKAIGARDCFKVMLQRVGSTFQLAIFDGAPFQLVPADQVPAEIARAGHGTQVVLHGSCADEDTVAETMRRLGGSKGLTSYLNSRFFTLPDGVKLSSVERSRTATSRSRDIKGQLAYLSEAAELAGVVELDGAAVHWFVVREDAREQVRDEVTLAGFVAALYQGELYVRSDGRAGLQMLRLFGVSAGTSRVALIVEPAAVQSNAARTGLRSSDGDEFSFSDVAERFRDAMPVELLEFIEQEMGKSDSDRADKLAERIARIAMLFQLRGRRRGSAPRPPADSKGRDETKDEDRPPRKPDKPGVPSGVDLELPVCEWVASRSRDWCGGDNRAAFYDQTANRLLLNKDFAPLVTLVETLVDEVRAQHPLSEQLARTVAEAHAQSWVEMQVTEAVFNARTLAAARGWSAEEAEVLLSPEALSLVASARYHTLGEVRKALRSLMR